MKLDKQIKGQGQDDQGKGYQAMSWLIEAQAEKKMKVKEKIKLKVQSQIQVCIFLGIRTGTKS